jgi:hypothetical protein
MTGFPIAIGTGPSSSTRRPHPVFDRHRSNENDVTTTMGSNQDESLVATVFLHYRFMEEKQADDDDKAFNVIADLLVQIGSSSGAFASNRVCSRETKCRVPLGIMKRANSRSFYQPVASVVFSSNERHLACLIPFPPHYESVAAATDNSNGQNDQLTSSIIVIFSIQSQTIPTWQEMKQKKVLPPLPDYVLEKTTNANPSPNETRGNSDKRDNHESSNPSLSETRDAAASTVPTRMESTNFYSRRELTSYIAHQPKIVRITQKQENNPAIQPTNAKTTCPPLQTATAICDIPTDSHCGKSSFAKSSLLIGTCFGSLILVDYASALVHSTLLTNTENEDTIPQTIVHIAQCPPPLWKMHDVYGEERGSQTYGRIVLVKCDGSAILFATSFELSESFTLTSSSSSFHRSGSESEYSRSSHTTGGLDLKLHKLHILASSTQYIRAKWLNPSYLVLLTRSSHLHPRVLSGGNAHVSSDVVMAQVWRVNDATTMMESTIHLVSELKQPLGDDESMMERAHGTFSITQPSLERCANGNGNASFEHYSSLVRNCESSMSLSYHRETDCLLVCSQSVMVVGSCSQPMSRQVKYCMFRRFTSLVPSHPIFLNPLCRQIKVHSCCLIWNWKKNVVGFTLVGTPITLQTHTLLNVPSFFSRFYISRDRTNGLSAIHVYEDSEKRMVDRDAFTLGILSPQCGNYHESLSVCETSPLLLLPDSVLYPFLDGVSACQDFSLHLFLFTQCLAPIPFSIVNQVIRLSAPMGRKQHPSLLSSQQWTLPSRHSQ